MLDFMLIDEPKACSTSRHRWPPKTGMSKNWPNPRHSHDDLRERTSAANEVKSIFRVAYHRNAIDTAAFARNQAIDLILELGIGY